ncbi:MAG TPA: hypothetical protein VJK48_02270 [Chlamydiales bacterium]|nr:hypothetical protein [Chlamydiales bacterium]
MTMHVIPASSSSAVFIQIPSFSKEFQKSIIGRVRECYRSALDDLALTQEELVVIDPIEHGPLQSAVVLSCGCVYSRETIQKWFQQPNVDTCPVRHSVNKRIQIDSRVVKDLVEKEVQRFIVNCEECVREDLELAGPLLAQAKHLQERESPNFDAALDLYKVAFKWTKSPFFYKEVIRLYEKMEQKDRAECAKVYLATLQLRENEIGEAIETLKSCARDVHSPLLSLQAMVGQFSSEEMIEVAKEFPDEEAMELYKVFIQKDPTYFPLYFAFALKYKSLQEKKEIFMQGLEVAKSVNDPLAIANFEMHIAGCEPSHFAISQEEWGDVNAIRVRIPWPQELVDLMEGLDGHLYTVFPIPSRLVIDGEEVPCTYDNIGRIARSKNPMCPGVADIWERIQEEEPVLEKRGICWAVMTKAILEGSRNQTCEQHIAEIQEWVGIREDRQGFEVPTAHDAFFALLWHWQSTPHHERLYADCFTRCQERVEGRPIVVGCFGPTGIHVTSRYGVRRECRGVGVLKKFLGGS